MELQKILYEGYTSFLDSHNGKRPKNPQSTHTIIGKEQLNKYKDNWKLLEDF